MAIACVLIAGKDLPAWIRLPGILLGWTCNCIAVAATASAPAFAAGIVPGPLKG